MKGNSLLLALDREAYYKLVVIILRQMMNKIRSENILKNYSKILLIMKTCPTYSKVRQELSKSQLTIIATFKVIQGILICLLKVGLARTLKDQIVESSRYQVRPTIFHRK